MSEDESGDKMHTLVYKGCHILLKEPFTPEEEAVMKGLIDDCRANGISPAKIVAYFNKEGL